MSNNKQSSVEWFAEQFAEHIEETYGMKITSLTILNKAKAMHKTEIIYAFQEGKCEGWENHELKIKGKKYQSVDPAEYYKEKFA